MKSSFTTKIKKEGRTRIRAIINQLDRGRGSWIKVVLKKNPRPVRKRVSGGRGAKDHRQKENSGDLKSKFQMGKRSKWRQKVGSRGSGRGRSRPPLSTKTHAALSKREE